jgi:hypothetical protein
MGCVTINEAASAGTKCLKTLVGLRQWFTGRHPSFVVGTCFTAQTVSGSSHIKIHATGRAIDIKVTSPNVQANKNAMWAAVNGLVAANCSLGVQRIYWDKRYWNANQPIAAGPSGWSAMSNWQIKQNPYTDHAHIEISEAFADSLTYENVRSILSSVVIPGGRSDAPIEATPTPTTPSTPSALAVDDATGQWTREQLIARFIIDNPLITVASNDDILTSVTCGGNAGFAVHKPSGALNAYGTAYTYRQSHASEFPALAGPVLDFLPYGNGYYVLYADGLTITGYGSDAAVVPVFTPCLFSGPWETLWSPISGVLVVRKTSSDMTIAQCAASVDDLSLTNRDGPCC